ncbi:type II secretion system F family protein [Alteribacillus sp. YIM 98480]|uniref:type II secretion system F family protein n=1 Tax=Alteribacillus sp. YIM 98480 TaxID=2606599 RepID=UPI001E4AC2F8|nr:type II secretion system F family protein [Alteribacillus sp. YIM 98480]
MERRINTYFYYTKASLKEMDEEELSFYQRVFKPGWKNVKKRFQKKLNRERISQLEKKLLQAGQPFGWSPVEFQLFQYLLAVASPLIVFAVFIVLGQPVSRSVLIALAVILLALFLPRYYLKVKAQKRIQNALKELPDTLDLLTISLEAGLGFDAALSKVVTSKQGVLADEFQNCLEELRLGRTRKEALSGMLERLSFDELKNFIYNVIQAERLGIGMVNVLKVQAEDVRESRRQRAEEAAMKAPIKMMFPLVLFIFPTLFIILLGPAILQFMEAF